MKPSISIAPLSIAMCQLNPTVGHVQKNVQMMTDAYQQTTASVVVSAEMAVTGYPLEDLVRKPALLAMVDDAIDTLAKLTTDGRTLIVGAPHSTDGGKTVYNSAYVLSGGAVQTIIHKTCLPNMGVFDEMRIFNMDDTLPDAVTVNVDGVSHKLGVMICEDIWHDTVANHLLDQGVDGLIVINGSPYDVNKQQTRLDTIKNRRVGVPVYYVNQVGGQDDLVFDGASFVCNGTGDVVAHAPSFQDHILETGCPIDHTGTPDATAQSLWGDTQHQTYNAMILSLRDYVNKNGFPGVVLGLSGGIDSALSAVVAIDALGAERVHCVMLPSPYTSQESLDDAQGIINAMNTSGGVKYDTVNIGPAMEAFDTMLSPLMDMQTAGIHLENIQSRSRGLALMALSNKTGHMVLTTGNKSEMAVGYATLYGDMCGGYNVLKDIYKTDVFALSKWRNENVPSLAMNTITPVMPNRIITKPPSAELRPDQKDEDSLPPYDILDGILRGLIELEKSVDDLVADGYDRATVVRIWNLLDISEYKRYQAPPGVKLTTRDLAKERRYPMTNSFRHLI